MSRKRSPAFTTLLLLATKLPWWLGIGLAVVSGVLLHWLADTPVMVDVKHMDSVLIHSVLKGVATFAQYFVPVIFIGGAIASFAGRRKQRQLLDSITTPAPLPVATPLAPETRPAQPKPSKPKVRAPVAQPPAPAQPVAPACPHCKKTMIIKVARTGRNAGGNFWGCTGYPQCRGIRAIFAPLPAGPV